jgi:hypothetical protein
MTLLSNIKRYLLPLALQKLLFARPKKNSAKLLINQQLISVKFYMFFGKWKFKMRPLLRANSKGFSYKIIRY